MDHLEELDRDGTDIGLVEILEVDVKKIYGARKVASIQLIPCEENDG
jgi:hypothetical protein